MLSHYLRVALRNLLRYKIFSFINVFGLALGMTICLISILQIKDAFQYDIFHPYPDRMYRILTDVTKQSGDKVSYASSPLPLGEKLQREYDFIEKVARIYNEISGEMSTDKKTLAVNGAFVDPYFFDIFGFRLATGQAAIAPRTVVLTAQTAKRFFGEEDPLGKTVRIEKLGLFTITGILQPAPYKSHLQFDLLASIATLPLAEGENRIASRLNKWETYEAAYTYVLLKQKMIRID
jgi:putative ABC transport system permease protein